ncbi:MAG TPA: CHRD domain-containing protein, partial [Geothrix sp.]|nr:CHRD domain-containing protein [Geothrix sp.]
SGNLYVNVHTAAFPGGEIRGQLNLSVPVIQTTTLNGSKEVPANASTATGTASVGLQPFTLEVTGGVTTTGLTGTASHIHEAAAGVSGPVAFGLTDGGTGTWLVPAGTRLTPSQFDAWRNGNLYVNVHTVAFPAGEIRGQLAPGGGTGGGGGGTGGGGGY